MTWAGIKSKIDFYGTLKEKKMEKEDLYKAAYSITKNYGQSLETLVERALMDRKYANKIHFIGTTITVNKASDAVRKLFLWHKTEEGISYWNDLARALEKRGM